jgi:hypothetical protein
MISTEHHTGLSRAKALIMARTRHLSLAFAAASVGLGVLTQPAHVAELWRPSAERAPIPDPPARPCNRQSWYNADRICLSWTAPHGETRRAYAASLNRSAAREGEHVVSRPLHR